MSGVTGWAVQGAGLSVPHHTSSLLLSLVLIEAVEHMQVQMALRHLMTKASQRALDSLELTSCTVTTALTTSHIGVVSS